MTTIEFLLGYIAAILTIGVAIGIYLKVYQLFYEDEK